CARVSVGTVFSFDSW
nr:immunoglobulin heavy chain junction region [Macaca mulatta]